MLLSTVGRASGRTFSKYLEPTGLRTRHMSAMLALRSGPQSQQDLAVTLDLHATKLVTLLNELEADGLTIRRRDPSDRRRHTVSLSELGRARLAALDIAKEKLEEVLFRDLTLAQRALLGSLLERVAANLGEDAP
jgi:DNA-binding MarR family transcriptional regulator